MTMDANTPSTTLLLDVETTIKNLAYALDGREPSELSSVIVGLRDIVAISGWCAQRAGEAFAKAGPLRHDGDLDTTATLAAMQAHLTDARVTLERVYTELSAAHNEASHLGRQ